MRDFIPLAVRKPVVHHPKSTTPPRPNEGSQFNSTENIQISNTPIKKVGTETPISDVDNIKLDRKLPRLIAV